MISRLNYFFFNLFCRFSSFGKHPTFMLLKPGSLFGSLLSVAGSLVSGTIRLLRKPGSLFGFLFMVFLALEMSSHWEFILGASRLW
ncbi:hypothetical protein XENTR_v10024433 [Xenopus tropicalis]|nr:hypothetical protein XENTR_v10024433 [Xenopus tropicalis]